MKQPLDDRHIMSSMPAAPDHLTAGHIHIFWLV